MPWPVWLTQEWWWLQFVLSYCPSDVSVKCVAWIWQDWSGELSRQMLYELGCYIFFFERLLHSWCVSCMQRSAHIWVFSSAPFFLLCSFCYVCACMTFITCMIMHCVFLLTLAVQNLFASHSWNMHAYMHACMHACIINIMHVARGYLAQTCVVIWLNLSRHHFWLPHGPTRMESRKEPCSIPSSRFPRTTRSNGVGYPVVV